MHTTLYALQRGTNLKWHSEPVMGHSNGELCPLTFPMPQQCFNNSSMISWETVTLGSPRYGQGPLGPSDIRSATRLPPQPPGPPRAPLRIWTQGYSYSTSGKQVHLHGQNTPLSHNNTT